MQCIAIYFIPGMQLLQIAALSQHNFLCLSNKMTTFTILVHLKKILALSKVHWHRIDHSSGLLLAMLGLIAVTLACDLSQSSYVTKGEGREDTSSVPNTSDSCWWLWYLYLLLAPQVLYLVVITVYGVCSVRPVPSHPTKLQRKAPKVHYMLYFLNSFLMT